MLKARWADSQRKEQSGPLHAPTVRDSLRTPRPALWYALCVPQLKENTDLYQHPRQMAALAKLCQRFSDTVSLEEPDAVLFEVRSALRYFGGTANIRRQLDTLLIEQLRQWQWHDVYHLSASPSPAASLLLARSGSNRLLYSETQLRSVLGPISVENLPVDSRIVKKLKNCGLLHLRDIWRMPTGELRLRFGKELSHYLDQLLNRRTQTKKRWQAPLVFRKTCTPDHDISSLSQILSISEDLLGSLEHFLKRHHLCTDQFALILKPERGQELAVSIRTRVPDREKKFFLKLVEEKFKDFKFDGAIVALQLYTSTFSPHIPNGGARVKSTSDHRHAHNPESQLLEQLAARLGNRSVLRFILEEEYTPEYACRYFDCFDKTTGARKSYLEESNITSVKLPCWLIRPARPLMEINGNLFYLSPLTIVEGPERIETRWWAGNDIRRDYYIARNEQGIYTWIYEELFRKNIKADKRSRWFLHGLFA
jgi:protein ImuB